MNVNPRPRRANRLAPWLAGSLVFWTTLVAMSACSDSPVRPSRDHLTEEDVSSLLDALGAAHAFDGGFEGDSPWSCTGGGRAVHAISRVIGSDPTTRVHATGTADYQACRIGPWVLDGQLAIDVELEFDQFGRILGASGTSDGSIQWESSSGSGECLLDLSIGFVQESLSVSGSACGRTVASQPVS